MNGSTQHYIGLRGFERLSRVNYPDGKVVHYQGKALHERIIAIEDVRCNRKDMPITKHYVGSRNFERLVKISVITMAQRRYMLGNHGVNLLPAQG